MVEVFKTNVKYQHHANILVEQIQKVFIDYEVNFDLEDCDKIMRVKCTNGIIDVTSLINLFSDFGFHAEVLPDHPLPFRPIIFGNEEQRIKISVINKN